MNVTGLPKRVRSIQRYREIFGILLKYGFDEIFERLRFEDAPGFLKKFFIRRKSREFVHMPRQVRLRLAVEELGPTFVKLGQMLSTRPDLIPSPFIEEFRRLQDNVAPFPPQDARRIIQEELKKDLKELFLTFEDRPLAAASIAQVHRAVTVSGEQVVLKVQRPGIRKTISRDMEILADLAHLLTRRASGSTYLDPVEVIDEFKSWIMKELDFLQEARNIDRFSDNFSAVPYVFVPKVYWTMCSPSVLTMEYVEAIPVLEIDALQESGLDPKAVARNGARAFLKQVFEDGFFHGDPHPGNLRVLPGNVIAPLDFGLMGRLDEEMLEQVGNLLAGIVNRDIDRIERVLLNIRLIGDTVDTQALKRDISEFIDRYYQIPLYKLNTEQIFYEMTEILSRHAIRLPRDLYLMIKALIIVESIGRKLDPEFDMVSLAKPYVKRIMFRKIDMSRVVRDGSLLIEDVRALFDDLPENLRQILLKIRRGALGVNLQHHGLEELIREIDRSSNRISFSLIIAALIIGSSYIMQLDKGPLLFGLPLFGFIGYSFAALLGVWLVLGIIRSGKM